MAGDPDKRRQLVETERKWIAARDAECKQLADDDDVIGSTRDYVLLKCAAEKTVERIGQLRAPDSPWNSK